jgi:hypothetical protein
MPAAVPIIENAEAGEFSHPLLLLHPMVKSASREVDVGVAFHSGRRSAIIRTSPGVYYRLKGCGDLDAGFPVIPVVLDSSSPLPSGEVQIRGAMFANTCATELAMSHEVEMAVRCIGFVAANSPVGWWQYTLEGAEVPFPEVQRCCGIFETVGDRRLFTHVLSGLDLLLPVLFPGDSFAGEKLAAALACAPAARIDTGAVSTTTAMALMMAPSLTAEDSLADASKLQLVCQPLSCAEVPAGVDRRWLPVWVDLVA